MSRAGDVGWLNELDAGACADALRRCCGSDAWVRSMVAERPFVSRDDLMDRSDRIWRSLQRTDWLEALAAHPRIGSRAATGWAAGEQASSQGASAAVLTRLSERNREYEARFGHIFIVCATGKSSDEMLALLEARLENEPDAEMRIAAEEQRKITRLRLDKLLIESAGSGVGNQRTGA